MENIIQKFNEKINKSFFNVSAYVNRYRDLIAENCSEAKLLVHLGAGRGNFNIFNEKAKFSGKLVALDIDKRALELNPAPIKILANAESMPFEDNSIDLIVTEHTFEHFEKPEKVLKECYRVLKPGGKLIFACPNKYSYISILGKIIPFKFHAPLDKLRGHKEAEIDCCPTLYRLNSISKIKKTAKRTGFRVEKLETFVGEPCYTTFLPLLHLFFVLWHKILEKCSFLKNLRISLVGVLEKPQGKRILVNTVSATSGGGFTYLYNITNQIFRKDKENKYFFLIFSSMHSLFPLPKMENVVFLPCKLSNKSLLYRILWHQIVIRRFIKEKKIDVLFSTGNFGLFFSPVKQILFNRNALYFSKDFEKDLLKRREYRKLIMTKLKRLWSILSILSADINLVPTKAFGEKIKQNCWVLRKKKFYVLYHGFDKEYFERDRQPLPSEILEKLKLKENYKRILFVSHYNYFRNFDTVIKSLPYLKKLLPKEKIMIILTTDIKKGAVYGGFDSTRTAKLIEKLNLKDNIAMLGTIPYSKLHHLYKLSDISLSPAYAESFGHPLLEAMSQGIPIVSADTPVHREVAQDSAIYFDVFNEKDLAQKCYKLLKDKTLYQSLKEKGLKRYKDFSWEEHLKKLLEIFEK